MARLLVSDGTVAKQAGSYKIAQNGVVKPILRACVAENGIVRQYWPTTSPSTDPRIVWNTTAFTVTESVQDPLDAEASIVFTRSLGTYQYDAYPLADVAGQYLAPALDGTASDDAKFYIKVDQVSGTALTGTLGSWVDLNSAATLTWSLDQTVVGTLSATANISIKDAAGITVVKLVTFSSSVVSESDIVWSTTQYDLVEIKESADADCVLTFNPLGYATGEADTSGSFNEAWHVDSPNLGVQTIFDRNGDEIVDRFGDVINSRDTDANEFSIKATLVSGTAPTGSALATVLPLNVLREWTLLATTGENLSCELDIEIDTVPTSAPIVKTITMNSQRTDASATPVWNTNAWTLTDSGFKQELALLGDVTVSFPLAANATATIQNTNGSDETYNVAWLPAGETASDYELRVSQVSGSATLTSHTDGVWYNAGTQRDFVIEYATLATARTSVFTVSVRKIGDLAVDKTMTINVAEDNGGAPP
ncbi:MAG: hypothetical protein KJO91_00510 [Gammaproteobacteria bacterium]|nr:hypothetical protein [Gammaproteobacteria bacterium]